MTATKVKFYYRNDTLVYNADAFQLAEGSMLDVLVKQLPGAELKSDGRIYVNGKFVENLLLNGRDFFRGNNRIMLDNLPSYMVKEVKVYDKQGHLSELTGRDMQDKMYVMDVSLKKQYNTGWLGNADIGGGTDKRYLARLFAMRFTDNSRLSMFFNCNNVNDHITPGENNDWSPEKIPLGRLTSTMAGIDLNVNDQRKRFELNSSSNYTNFGNNIERRTNRTNFLEGGDTYQRTKEKERVKNYTLSTNNRLALHFGQDRNSNLYVSQDFSYTKETPSSYGMTATSARKFEEYTEEFVDSLYNPVLTDEMRRKLINRTLNQWKRDGHAMNGSLTLTDMTKMNSSDDVIQFGVTVGGYSKQSKDFSRYTLDYKDDDELARDYRNRYSGSPSHGYNFSGELRYYQMLARNLNLRYVYGFKQNYDFAENSLYRLDRLNGWSYDTEHEFGQLPSVTEYERTQDTGNSYRSREMARTQHLQWQMNWTAMKKNQHTLVWLVGMDGFLNREKLGYARGTVDTTFVRTRTYLNPSTTLLWFRDDDRLNLRLDYSMNSRTPDMVYSVNYIDDADPLNIRLGNQNLKTERSHNVALSFTNRLKPTVYNAELSLNVTQNAIGMGYVYDRDTGRRVYTPANVDGGWWLAGFVNVSGNLDKKRLFSYNNRVQGRFVNSVDLIGVDRATVPAKSTVKTLWLHEGWNMNYRLGSNSLGMVAEFNWIGSRSARKDFSPINAFDYNYGLTALLNLPWKFQISTDIRTYSRRGYEDNSMNTDDIAWNARISRPILKGRVVLIADAFDILGQLNNVNRYVNVQGRVETFSNVVPRYVMLHAIYRLNVLPKKKRQP